MENQITFAEFENTKIVTTTEIAEFLKQENEKLPKFKSDMALIKHYVNNHLAAAPGINCQFFVEGKNHEGLYEIVVKDSIPEIKFKYLVH